MFMTQESPSRELDKVIVRLPHGMRDALKRLAVDNNRSLNAEIVARLEASLAQRDDRYLSLAKRIETLEAEFNQRFGDSTSD